MDQKIHWGNLTGSLEITLIVKKDFTKQHEEKKENFTAQVLVEWSSVVGQL